MKPNKASRTAEATVAVRFSHMLYDDPKVFEDHFARELTSSTWKAICTNRLLYQLIVRGWLRSLRPVHGLILARSRYAEEMLESAFKQGMFQYVLLGAGFDSYALRKTSALARLSVFEVDHPASQALKQKRLAKIGLPAVPDNLHFIALDFEEQTLGEALTASPLNLNAPAFFAWLGTIYYLHRTTVEGTLRTLSSICCEGTQLVFDYLVPDKMVPTRKRAALRAIRKFASRRSEPILSTFQPIDVEEFAQNAGFEVTEDLSAEDLGRRYFSSRNDDLVPLPGCRIAHLSLKSPR